MEGGIRLGYLLFDVRRPAHWARFCESMLGLSGPTPNVDGSFDHWLDDGVHRLVIRPGGADDLGGIGLCCATEGVFNTLTARLRAYGYGTQAVDDEVAAARHAARMQVATDPAGNRVELYVEDGASPAVAGRTAPVPGGFVTGELGLGHAVLVGRDLEAMERFYVDGLGFGVSERLKTRVGPVTMRGVFLHCNRRHHSLALFDLPWRKRLHHFMLQTREFADVGVAYERARRLKVPLSLGLGQHPDPDGTFSFYGRTPSGFDFEIGAGSGEIEPARWEPMSTAMASQWGHQPQLALRLRVAAALVTRRFGARSM